MTTVVVEQPADYTVAGEPLEPVVATAEVEPTDQNVVVEATVLVASGGTGYEHVQATAAEVWTVVHNLGYRPAVSTFDTNGDPVVGQPAHIDANSLSISFATAVAGRAYLS